jgi:hypothetical protein
MRSSHQVRPNLRRRAVATGLLGLTVSATGLLAACGGGGDSTSPAPTAPALQILSNDTDVLAAPTEITFLFSADVTQFAADKFQIAGGTVNYGSFTKVSDREYNVIVTPRGNQTGTLVITVPPGAYADATGIVSNREAYYFTRAFDTVVPPNVPTVDFADDAPGFLTSGPVTLTITFSLDVGTSFSLADLIIENANASLFTPISQTEYTVRLTPNTTDRAVMSVTLPEGAVTAEGGSPNNRSWAWGKIYNPPVP